MLNQLIEATLGTDKERGTARAFLSPYSTGNEPSPHIQHKLNRLTAALKGVTPDRLKTMFIDQIQRGNAENALLVSNEMTQRGIAPCFRGLPVKKVWWSGNPDTDFIIMAADLQWIAARYPRHRTDWERAQGIFDPRKFRKTAEYLHWNGHRTAGQVAKALGLSEQQQRECAWIQCLHVERWRQRLHLRWAHACVKITGAIRAHDKRPAAEQDATIKRRSDLWLCAELADGSPQRTADLFAMLTGEVLPRNLVAKQLGKLPKVRRSDLFSSS